MPLRKVDDAEEMLCEEMVARVARAADELRDALHALADVAVSTPQEGDPHQWRWHLSQSINYARNVIRDERFR